MSRLTWVAAAGSAMFLLTACGGANDFTPTQSATAQEIFAQTCAGCHGDKGQGKMGFLLKIAGDDDDAEAIALKIAKGGAIMPSFPNIPEKQRVAVAEYVKGL
ncbi:c-type cytochrome [Magnetofaba australis]|nr:cytochrome c [Magnetofaba australis]